MSVQNIQHGSVYLAGFAGYITLDRMALHLLAIEDVRAAARQRLESCELWLRRLVHDQMHEALGADFVMTGTFNGQPILSRDVRNRIATRIAAQPGRYPRQVDALLLDDLAALLAKEDLYRKFFAVSLRGGFPLGREHVRCVLGRLIPVRNALSHANPISSHDAERALCYCSDIINSLAEHYKSIGMSQDFDAPSFARYSDSLGNVFQPTETRGMLDLRGNALRAGMTLRCEVEVDAHYDPAEYTIHWEIGGIEKGTGRSISLVVGPKHVGERMLVEVRVISLKEWHRHRLYDADIGVLYRVLPPIAV